MNEDSPYSSYNLDHLGLIAGMVDELGLPVAFMLMVSITAAKKTCRKALFISLRVIVVIIGRT